MFSRRSTRKSLMDAAAAGLFALAAPGAVFGQCAYDVTAIIAAPPCQFGSTPVTIGRGLNNMGHVAGSRRQCDVGADEAFYWTPETGFVTMPRPDGVWSAKAYDINDDGLVVGQHAFTGVGWKGFVYDTHTGEYTYLEPLHDVVSVVTVSSANAINNAGIVAGSRLISKPDEPTVFNAVIWDTTTGEITDLGVMNGPYSEALDISTYGDVTGWTGEDFFFSDDYSGWRKAEEVVIFDPPPAGINSIGLAINNNGMVAGVSGIQTKDDIRGHAVKWDGQWTEIVSAPFGFDHVSARDVNDWGQAVVLGTKIGGGSSEWRPFLWLHGELHNVNDLLGDGLEVQLRRPQAINNNGTQLLRGIHQGGNVGVLIHPAGQPTGDLDHDCKVGIGDLLILISEWGKPDSRADLNEDGTVGVADLLILIENWTFE